MSRNDLSDPGFAHTGVHIHSQYGVLGLVPATPPKPPAHLPAAINASALGEALYKAGDFRAAIPHLAEVARLYPENGLNYLNLACANWLAGELKDVEALFATALARSPGEPAIRETMARWYLQLGQIDKALECSSMALILAPDRDAAKIAHAEALWGVGQCDAAWKLVQPIVAAGVGGLPLTVFYATIAPRIGHQAQALAAIQRELQSPATTLADRTRLLYVSVDLLNSTGQFDLAFERAKAANESKKRPFDPTSHSSVVSERIRYYTKDRVRSLPRATYDSSRIVLIVGMPRSGTTLVEQILASHPSVHGAGELMHLYNATLAAGRAVWSKGEPFPHTWNHLSVNRANELAATYLSEIARINSTAVYVTDKMPTNYLVLGAAQLLLPQCKIIHCQRDPRDTCVSCFFTDFAIGNEFSLNLSHMASYYRDYQRLMAHWKSVLDLPILDVRYEDVVADQESQTRRMLQFLDLPWNDQCLKPHKNNRFVATASRDQVRQPMYSTSVGRWKNYERHIPELLALAES